MRCEKCGADIGEKKVCPFCATPIKNVLIEDNLTRKRTEESKIKYAFEDQTNVIMINSYDWDETSIITEDKKLSDTENVKAEKRKKQRKKIKINKKDNENNNDDERNFISVIPDFDNNIKNKKINLVKVITVFLVIIWICLVGIAYLCVKKYKNYKEQLFDVTVELYDETIEVSYIETSWEEDKENNKLFVLDVKGENKVDVNVPDYITFVKSSYGRYGAYETLDTYETWVEDNTENGKHKEIIYSYQLYLVTKYGEQIRLLSTEKNEGEIELLGVTDNGGIIYTDTEEKNSYCVDQRHSFSFDSEIMTLLTYQNGVYVFIDFDKQLILKNNNNDEQGLSDCIISSDVDMLYYLDAKCNYGLLEKVEGIISTDSISKTIAYESRGKFYKIDLSQEYGGSETISKEKLITDDETYMTNNLDSVDLSNENLNGKGKIYIGKGKKLYYKLGPYKRKLTICDEIVGLVGTKAFYMYDNKMYEIDVFSREQEKISDYKKKIIIKN